MLSKGCVFPGQGQPQRLQGAQVHEPDETEEELYAHALAEFEGANRRLGLWAKAFAEAQGNESLAKANYLRGRVEQLTRERDAHSLDLQRRQEAERQQSELARVREEQRKYALLPKGACPNCRTEIPLDSAACPKCIAIFVGTDTWKVIPLSNGKQLEAIASENRRQGEVQKEIDNDVHNGQSNHSQTEPQEELSEYALREQMKLASVSREELLILRLAARNGELEKVRGLLAVKPNLLNLREPNDAETALFSAVHGSQLEMIKFLLSLGASVELRDVRGKTAYEYALETRSKPLIDAFQPSV